VAFIALNADPGVGRQTPSPSASLEPSEAQSAPASEPGPSASGQPTATPVPTAVVLPSVDPSASGLPTPGPDDESTGFIVVVSAGEYPVRRIDEGGDIVGEAVATFDRRSGAPVERVLADGDVYWRTLAGDYFELSYSRALSDDFVVYETFETDDGEPRFRELDEGEYLP
jgi:hypothetical protein